MSLKAADAERETAAERIVSIHEDAKVREELTSRLTDFILEKERQRREGIKAIRKDEQKEESLRIAEIARKTADLNEEIKIQTIRKNEAVARGSQAAQAKSEKAIAVARNAIKKLQGDLTGLDKQLLDSELLKFDKKIADLEEKRTKKKRSGPSPRVQATRKLNSELLELETQSFLRRNALSGKFDTGRINSEAAANAAILANSKHFDRERIKLGQNFAKKTNNELRKLQEDIGSRNLSQLNKDKAFSKKSQEIRERSFQERATALQKLQDNESEVFEAIQERRFEIAQSINETEQRLAEDAERARVKLLNQSTAAAQNYADALSMPLDPLLQLVERQDSANQGLQVLGATMAATAAATRAYAQSNVEASNSQERLVKTSPAMISAGGTAAAAFVKQTKTKALIQGAFESASSISAFATGNIVGGVGHAAAAAAFFALAGQGSGGGGKAPKAKREQAALTSGGAMGGGFTKSTAPIVVNVQGFALGSASDIGTSLGSTIQDVRETGINTNRV
jgi:hypothetical protein